MSSISLTGSGIVVALVTWLLAHSGLTLGDEQVNVLVKDLFEVVGIVMTIVGQIRRGDLHFGIVRR